MKRSRHSERDRRGRLTTMRLTGKTPWLFAAALGTAVACGGVSDENFYDGPAKRVASKGGGAGVGAGTSTGGSGGTAPSVGGSTGSSGGSGATVGGSSAVGGDTTGGGSGGTGNVSATGGGGDAPAMGGTAPAVGGTMGDAGAGDAPSGGTGGDVSPGGMGGSTPMAGAGGTAGMGGIGGMAVGGAGMSGAGMGGEAGKATGGRGGRGGGDCEPKLKAVEEKLTAAQVCDRSLDASCLGFVDDECGCPVPVNNPNSAAAKAYRAAIEDAAGCIACTTALCAEPQGSYCQGSGPGDGHCVATQFNTTL
ncbi:MAG TPA: hypothetical protein VNN72_10800 [Polyangiaceae bacterium]|nr:hypothetical protein [Polyangiaceae bacterium]